MQNTFDDTYQTYLHSLRHKNIPAIYSQSKHLLSVMVSLIPKQIVFRN